MKTVWTTIGMGQLHRHLTPYRHSPAIGILFAGDRSSCCDEAVAAYRIAGAIELSDEGIDDNDEFIGAATIAPNGEYGTGPAIVGLWVRPKFRNCGVGTHLLTVAINRMIERGLVPTGTRIRLDVLSSKVKRIIDNLPKELQEKLDVVNHPSCDFILDS